jgi:tRNA uracil 4-sulfurtransferase
MTRYIIIHYGEIYLKGQNQGFFINKLINNIKLALSDLGYFDVQEVGGRLVILIEENWDLQIVQEKLSKVFGIENFAFAWNSAQDIEQIEQDLYSLIKTKKFKTFRITTRRADKSFALNSQQIDTKLGAMVVKKMKKKVDLVKFDLNCHIDLVRNFVFLYFDKFSCRGGLPVGTSEPLICLLSGGIDSPVAANLLQKRGAPVIYLNFDAYPATPKENQEKVKDLVKVLNAYQFKSKLYLIPFLEIQKEIIKKVPEDYRVIFYRRMMLRLAEMIASQEKVLGLVTGESLGQVASQTIENINAISQAIDLPILRPCIGLNKEEIITLAKQIGTYEISSQPFKDCCSLYIPKHPVTRSDLNLILKTEKGWNYQKFLNHALKNLKSYKF